jgi:F0F1-type ATP synthase assembly protein I
MAQTAKAWGMALDLVFTTVGMFFLGYLFDTWQSTGPWGAVVGVVLGFVTAAVRLIRTSLRQEAARRKRD